MKKKIFYFFGGVFISLLFFGNLYNNEASAFEKILDFPKTSGLTENDSTRQAIEEPASEITCGINAYGDVYMTEDILNCPGVGINVAIDGITIDCNGHTIGGDSSALHAGIYINGHPNVNVVNCVIQDFDAGIDIFSSPNTQVNNSTIQRTPWHGVYISESDNVSLLNNNFYSIDSVKIQASDYFTGQDNTFNSVNEGFEIYDSSNSLFYSNEITNAGSGFYLSNGQANEFNGNIVNSTSFGHGLSLAGSTQNNIWNNYFYDCDWGSVNEDSFSNNNNWDNGVIGNYYFDFASNPGYPDTFIVPGLGDGVDYFPIWNKPPFLEPIGNQETEEESTLIIDLEASDPDEDDLTYWTDAYLVISSGYYFNDETGYFEWTPEVGDEGGYNITFSVTDGEFSDEETITIYVNPRPTKCGDIITEDLDLQNDLTLCPGHGLVAGADNIIIDCNGHTIQGDKSADHYGVYLLNRQGVRVQDCVIQDFRYGGIMVDGGSGNIIDFNELNQEINNGIRVENSSSNYVTNNTVNSLGSIGIYVRYADNNYFQNNHLDYVYEHGLYLYESDYNSISGNDIIDTRQQAGIYLYYSHENEIFNNYLDHTIPFQEAYYGISVSRSNNNNIHHNQVYRTERYGIALGIDSHGNTLSENNLSDNQLWDIYINEPDNSCPGNTGSGNRPIGFINTETTLDSGLYSELILCEAHNSNISNVNIQGSDTIKNNGILMVGTDNALFSNVTSSGNNSGITFSGSDYNTVQNSFFNDNGDYENSFDYQGLALYLTDSHYNVFSGNQVNNNITGSEVFTSTNNQFTNNSFQNNKTGLFSYHGDYNKYETNQFIGNNYGLFLNIFSDDNIVNQNIFENNLYHGIYGVNTNNNNFKGNNFLGNQRGIYLSSGSNNIFTENNLSGNEYGIYLAGGYYNNYTKNWFYNNSIHAFEEIGATGNNWDVDGIGNYWDDYSGAGEYEISGDGLGVDHFPIWDRDQDGYLSDEDCDDSNPEINPDAKEVCDGVDNDCNGVIDKISRWCGETMIGMCQMGVEVCSEGIWGECAGAIYPTREICDGLDNDCDGVVDNDCQPKAKRIPFSQY